MCSDCITLNAKAKINIVLDVIGKRQNGYHDIRTIMQSINLCDIVTISKQYNNKISIISNSSKIPNDDNNIAYKAADFLKKNYFINSGILIKIEKNIPVAAGLAGGSADCAAALIGVKNLFNISISEEDLFSAAALIGADVPFCLKGGTCLAEGIGEILTEISSFPEMYVLLAKPDTDISTAWVYKNFDSSKVQKKPNIEKMIKDISNKNIKDISSNLCNVLESVTIKEFPIIDDLKKSMINFGALGALMSGSGPTVFGLFENKNDCVNSLNYIKNNFGCVECFLTSISK